MAQAQKNVHFITAIGLGNYVPVFYSWGGKTHPTKYAPAALAHLLPLSGARGSVLATETAMRGPHLQQLVNALRQAGVHAEPVQVNDGVSPDDFTRTLQQLIDLVEEGEGVVLDVTFSLRHLPFAYLAALTYLTAFKNVSMEGIYYGAYEQRRPGDKGMDIAPIHDLSVLFDATTWYHAVLAASRSGDFRPLQETLDRTVRAERQRTHSASPLGRLAEPLRPLAGSLAAGLPLETGLSARDLLDALRAIQPPEIAPTLSRLSLQPFETQLGQLAAAEEATRREQVMLDDAELRRQLALVRWHAERGNAQQATMLLREWLISRVYAEHGDRSNWLGYRSRRKPVENALNAAVERKKQLGRGASEVISLWSAVAEARNRLAHLGTDIQPPDGKGAQKRVEPPSRQRMMEWIDACERLISTPIDLAPQGRDRILLSPLGFTPGVLFTAATHQKPDRVIVLASEETASSAEQALRAAGMESLPLEVHKLADPHAGIEEAKGIASRLKTTLAEARELVVNLTGGTTAMQIVVEEVAATARRFGIPVKRILLIDRRTPQQQRDDPYQLGQVVELSERDSDGDA